MDNLLYVRFDAFTGGRLKKWRKSAGITQAEMSEALGISQGMYSKIERGGIKGPSPITLAALRAVVGKRVREILNENSAD